MPNFSNNRMFVEKSKRKEFGLRLEGRRCRVWPDGGERAEVLVDWEGGAALIDKYDARCWLTKVELENPAKDVYVEDITLETLCDEERYLDLIKAQQQSNSANNNEVLIIEKLRISPEKEINTIDIEDNVKQSNNREYGAVNFSYEDIKSVEKETIIEDIIQAENEEDIPYQCPVDLIIPDNIILPETEKQAAKIEKTATFIANNGTQMEILVKTKQSKNDQFQFLNNDNKLNPFYKFLLEKIKSAEYIPARRHLCHLTKKEESKESVHNPPKLLPKIDISNTAYFKLINKYRSDNPNTTADSPQMEEIHDNNIADDMIITEDNSTVDPSSNTKQNNAAEEKIEKLYTTLYEQYYSYYYNYYYQLHNSTSLSQDSSDLRIEEDSKSMAINAAIYAAKAAVEKYQKEQEEKDRIEEERKVKSRKTKEHCAILRYIHYIVMYGEEFEYSMMKNGDHLKFLDPESPNHNFYQQCLKRARRLNKIDEDNKTLVETPSFPKWEDYIKKESVGIKFAPKLIADTHKSCITLSVHEKKLMEITQLISNLLNAEKVGRESCLPKVIDVKATRKRKATEFMEKIREQAAQSSESEKEEKHKKSKKSSSKKRKHRHR